MVDYGRDAGSIETRWTGLQMELYVARPTAGGAVRYERALPECEVTDLNLWLS